MKHADRQTGFPIICCAEKAYSLIRGKDEYKFNIKIRISFSAHDDWDRTSLTFTAPPPPQIPYCCLPLCYDKSNSRKLVILSCTSKYPCLSCHKCITLISKPGLKSLLRSWSKPTCVFKPASQVHAT